MGLTLWWRRLDCCIWYRYRSYGSSCKCMESKSNRCLERNSANNNSLVPTRGHRQDVKLLQMILPILSFGQSLIMSTKQKETKDQRHGNHLWLHSIALMHEHGSRSSLRTVSQSIALRGVLLPPCWILVEMRPSLYLDQAALLGRYTAVQRCRRCSSWALWFCLWFSQYEWMIFNLWFKCSMNTIKNNPSSKFAFHAPSRTHPHHSDGMQSYSLHAPIV